MSQDPKDDDDEMRQEYDFSDAVRGKFYERYNEGTNIVVLDPDVAQGAQGLEISSPASLESGQAASSPIA